MPDEPDPMIVSQPPLFFEDLSIGQSASLVGTVSETDLDGFADDGESSDRRRLRASVEGGSPVGQQIPLGMFTINLVSAVLGTKLPGPGAAYLSKTVQFLGPVHIGDVVTAHAEVVELIHSRHRARIFFECLCNGKAVLEGEVWLAVRARGAASA